MESGGGGGGETDLKEASANPADINFILYGKLQKSQVTITHDKHCRVTISITNQYKMPCNVAQTFYNYEKRHEKTGFRGVRPGLTQTDLYSHRSRLEA